MFTLAVFLSPRFDMDHVARTLETKLQGAQLHSRRFRSTVISEFDRIPPNGQGDGLPNSESVRFVDVNGAKRMVLVESLSGPYVLVAGYRAGHLHIESLRRDPLGWPGHWYFNGNRLCEVGETGGHAITIYGTMYRLGAHGWRTAAQLRTRAVSRYDEGWWCEAHVEPQTKAVTFRIEIDGDLLHGDGAHVTKFIERWRLNRGSLTRTSFRRMELVGEPGERG